MAQTYHFQDPGDCITILVTLALPLFLIIIPSFCNDCLVYQRDLFDS